MTCAKLFGMSLFFGSAFFVFAVAHGSSASVSRQQREWVYKSKEVSQNNYHSDHELLPVFDSLDQNPVEPTQRKKHDVVYRQIKPHSYLFYDW
jgi:hypothetical protein